MQDRERTIERALGVDNNEDALQLRELFPIDNTLLMKSELPPGLMLPIARAKILSRITSSKVLGDYVTLILKAQISKDRKGRLELMEALVANRRAEMDEDF